MRAAACCRLRRRTACPSGGSLPSPDTQRAHCRRTACSPSGRRAWSSTSLNAWSRCRSTSSARRPPHLGWHSKRHRRAAWTIGRARVHCACACTECQECAIVHRYCAWVQIQVTHSPSPDCGLPHNQWLEGGTGTAVSGRTGDCTGTGTAILGGLRDWPGIGIAVLSRSRGLAENADWISIGYP